MTLEASRRERHAVRSQTELEGSLYGLRPSRDAAQPDAARGLGSLMGGGRVPSSSAMHNGTVTYGMGAVGAGARSDAGSSGLYQKPSARVVVTAELASTTAGSEGNVAAGVVGSS